MTNTKVVQSAYLELDYNFTNPELTSAVRTVLATLSIAEITQAEVDAEKAKELIKNTLEKCETKEEIQKFINILKEAKNRGGIASTIYPQIKLLLDNSFDL